MDNVLEQEVLHTWYDKLINTIDVENLLPRLYSLKIIHMNDKERIRAEKTRRDRAESLLDLIVRSDNPGWFGLFVDTLDEHYPFLAQDLRRAVRGKATRPPLQRMNKLSGEPDSLYRPNIPPKPAYDSSILRSSKLQHKTVGGDSTRDNSTQKAAKTTARPSKSEDDATSSKPSNRKADRLNLVEIQSVLDSLKTTLNGWKVSVDCCRAFRPLAVEGSADSDTDTHPLKTPRSSVASDNNRDSDDYKCGCHSSKNCTLSGPSTTGSSRFGYSDSDGSTTSDNNTTSRSSDNNRVSGWSTSDYRESSSSTGNNNRDSGASTGTRSRDSGASTGTSSRESDASMGPNSGTSSSRSSKSRGSDVSTGRREPREHSELEADPANFLVPSPATGTGTSQRSSRRPTENNDSLLTQNDFYQPFSTYRDEPHTIDRATLPAVWESTEPGRPQTPQSQEQPPNHAVEDQRTMQDNLQQTENQGLSHYHDQLRKVLTSLPKHTTD